MEANVVYLLNSLRRAYEGLSPPSRWPYRTHTQKDALRESITERPEYSRKE